MLNKLLVLTFLVVLSYAQYSDMSMYELQKIDRTSFGKKLLDTIQLELSTEQENLVDKTLNLLNNMLEEMKEDQKNDDAENEKIHQNCDSELKILKAQIQDATEKSSELQIEIEAKQEAKGLRELQIGEYTQVKGEEQTNLKNLREKLVQIEQTWANAQDDHHKASYTIMRAKQIIEGEFRKDQQFLQLPPAQNLVQVSAHFQNAAINNTFQKKSLNSFFKILAQISSSAPIQADPMAVQKILEICEEILNKLEDSLAQEKLIYVSQKSTTGERIENTEKSLEKLTQDLADLDVELSGLVTRINQAKSDKDFNDQVANDSTLLEKSKHQYCFDQYAQYEQRTKNREQEQDIIVQVVTIITKQEQSLRRFINSRRF